MHTYNSFTEGDEFIVCNVAIVSMQVIQFLPKFGAFSAVSTQV